MMIEGVALWFGPANLVALFIGVLLIGAVAGLGLCLT
jgi:hypothetical protein